MTCLRGLQYLLASIGTFAGGEGAEDYRREGRAPQSPSTRPDQLTSLGALPITELKFAFRKTQLWDLSLFLGLCFYLETPLQSVCITNRVRGLLALNNCTYNKCKCVLFCLFRTNCHYLTVFSSWGPLLGDDWRVVVLPESRYHLNSGLFDVQTSSLLLSVL